MNQSLREEAMRELCWRGAIEKNSSGKWIITDKGKAQLKFLKEVQRKFMPKKLPRVTIRDIEDFLILAIWFPILILALITAFRVLNDYIL